MAGNVQSNVHINVTSNFDEMVRQLNESYRILDKISNMGSANFTGVFDKQLNALENYRTMFDNNNPFAGVFDTPINAFEEYRENIVETNNATIELDNISNDLVDTLLGIASTGRISAGSIYHLTKSLGAPMITIVALEKAFEMGSKQVENFIDDMKELGSVLGDGAYSVFDTTIDGLEYLNSSIKEVCENIKEFSEYGVKVQANYYSMANFLEDEAVVALGDYAQSLNDVLGINPNMWLSNLEGILSVAKNTAKTAEEQVAVVKALNNTAYDVFAKTGGAYGNVEAIKNQMENAINLNVLNSRSAIAKALDLTDDMIEEFKELGSVTERYNWILEKTTNIQGLYTKWLQTESGQVELLKQNYQLLLDNIGQLALSLYARLAPVLNLLLNMANSVLDSLLKLFNVDLESSAMANSVSSYSSVANSIEEIGNAATNVERKLAKFDDVIQIKDNKQNNLFGDMSVSDIGINNDWIDNIKESESEIKKLADRLKELLEQGKYYDAGAFLADTLNGWLEDIPWDDIQNKLEWFGLYFANFLNGLFENTKLFGNIGTTLAEGINSVFSLLLGFGRNFNFAQFGVSAGVLWDSFWDDLDASDIGETFYQYIIGGFEALAGFLEEGSLSDATSKIGDIIVSFFNNFDEDDIKLMANSIINLIDSVFTGIGDLHDKLKDSGIKEKITLFLTELFTGFSENSENWGTTLGNAIGDILDFAGDMLETADKTGLTKGIHNFLDALDLPNVFKQWFELKSEELEIVMMSVGDKVLDMIISGIYAALLKAMQYLVNYIIIFISWGLEQLMLGIGNILDVGVTTLNAAVSIIGLILSEILLLFAPDEAKEAMREWLKGFSDGLTEWWKSVKNWWNNNVAKDLTFTTPDWLGGKTIGFKIPKLATGGIIGSPTLAMVGENGAEAIVPLENNLGWIDKLATRVASKINNNKGSNTPVQIPMHELQKPFYSRSEMLQFAELVVNSLRQYGVNVALVN